MSNTFYNSNNACILGVRGCFCIEPDIVRRVVTSRSGLYEGLGCSERLVKFFS